MVLEELLSHLRSLEVKLWVDGENLALRAPKGVLSAELREELRQRKPEILALLGGGPAEPIPRLPARESYELSHSQRRLWVLSQDDESSAAYVIPLSIILEGRLDTVALERAFAALVARHESLRTSFVSEGDEPRQKIHEAPAFELSCVDLSDRPDAEAEARARAARLYATPFVLSRPPLFHAELLKLARERYALLFVMHHIISDGWSLSVLVRELNALYEAFRRGRPDPLAPLPIQYRDYAAWQARLLRGESADAHRAFWHERLKAPLAVLDLPADLPRPPVQRFRGDLHTLRLDAPLREGLARLAGAHNATLFMVLTALVKTLLFRYTGQEDVIVGTPVSGRGHPDLEGQIGFYLNTVALRDRVEPEMTFAQLVARVRQGALEAFEHQAYPLDKLVDELKLNRDLSRSPVFDVMLILQNAGSLELALEGVRVTPLGVNAPGSKCDLTFDFSDEGDRLAVGIRYNTDIFLRERVERMGAHFAELVESVLGDPDRPLWSLELLPPAERRQLLRDFNDTASDAGGGATLVELFAARAAAAPDSAAVSFEGRTLTYRQLDELSDELARRVAASAGAWRAEALVGVVMRRSPEMLAALLGTLKSGHAYVPIDPEYPRRRVAAVLADSRAAVVLTERALLPELEEVLAGLEEPPAVVCVDERDGGDAVNVVSARGAAVLPRSLAYVIYTSGSTGEPKGVQIQHDSLANFLASFGSALSPRPSDVFLAVTTVSFDIAGLELYLPLVTGARVEIVSSETASDGMRLAERLGAGDVTFMQATPSTWRMLLASGWGGDPGLTILCGGEALPRELAEALAPKCRALWNLYGPTETTIWSSAREVGAESLAVEHAPPVVGIGRPVGNTQLYVLDAYLQPAPVGVPGELYIGGAGLARGYRGRPRLTAERFIPDPFGAEPGRRLYRTGDVARLHADGGVEYLGRADHQVKVRGFRIELGEVESALRGHAGVREAVVVSRRDATGEAELVAYYVAAAEPVAASALREQLSRHLPDYMLPSAFVALERLPLTPNGKVDRAALPAPDADAGRADGYVEPAGGTEREIADVWQEVLQIERVGAHDNFFELGGHSIKGTRIVHRLRSAFGFDLKVRDLFHNPTVAALASLAEGRRTAPQPSIGAPAPSIAARGVETAPGAIAQLTAEELEVLDDDDD